MKKLLWLLFAVLIALPASAQNKKHNLEIAYERSSYTYKEPHMENPIKDYGMKNGVSLLYTMRSVLSRDLNEDDPSFAMLELRYMTGDVKYKGWVEYTDEYWNSWIEPFSKSGLRDYYFEAAFKLGRTYQLAAPLELWPYFGIGWRYLTNHAEELGEGGYKRTQTYIYVPIGTNLKWDVSKNVTITLNGQFDWLIHGNNHSDEVLTDSVVLGTWSQHSLSFSQSQGYGLRASVKAEVDAGKIGFFVEPFWRYWHIQNSDVVSFAGKFTDDEGNEIVIPDLIRFWEPFNTTHEYGLRVGITF